MIWVALLWIVDLLYDNKNILNNDFLYLQSFIFISLCMQLSCIFKQHLGISEFLNLSSLSIIYWLYS